MWVLEEELGSSVGAVSALNRGANSLAFTYDFFLGLSNMQHSITDYRCQAEHQTPRTCFFIRKDMSFDQHLHLHECLATWLTSIPLAVSRN
ncbi:rCG39584 [Rattus norvegicus]|uniref:RCG39584 n=1 Tax=Rattus norvegicus TaxID=10116 RepID=A6I869_RAT|nr:rCG39584 [Rattus norvegicus]